MHVPINIKSPNNINEWQMGFNSAFKGLRWNFMKWDVGAWIGWSWIRIGEGGGNL